MIYLLSFDLNCKNYRVGDVFCILVKGDWCYVFCIKCFIVVLWSGFDCLKFIFFVYSVWNVIFNVDYL